MCFNLKACHIAEFVLDPLEAVSHTCFKLSFHCQNIIRLDSLLPLKLWIIWCNKTTSLITWTIKIIWVGPFSESKFSVRTRIFRKWLAFFHDQKHTCFTKKPSLYYLSLSHCMKQEMFVLHEEKMRQAGFGILRREGLSHDHVWWHPMCHVGSMF